MSHTTYQLNWKLKHDDCVSELHTLRKQMDALQAQRDALMELAEGQARKLDAIDKWVNGVPK